MKPFAQHINCLLIFGYIGLNALPVSATHHINQILDSRTIQIVWEPGDLLPKEDAFFAIQSQNNSEILGHGRIREIQERSATGVVLTHSQNRLIRTGDKILLIDLSSGKNALEGRSDLLQRNRPRASARYKPLVHQGPLIGQTAQTLDEGEALVDLTTLILYGVNSRLTLYSLALGDLSGLPNLGAKVLLYDGESLTLSPAVEQIFDIKTQGTATNISIHLDSPSNAKFLSHTKVTISAHGFTEQEGNELTRKTLFSSSIQSGTEFIMNNWDRILFGPRYVFEQKSVGGYLTYLAIWDHFHLQVGFSTQNILKWNLDFEEGLAPVVDLMWRF